MRITAVNSFPKLRFPVPRSHFSQRSFSHHANLAVFLGRGICPLLSKFLSLLHWFILLALKTADGERSIKYTFTFYFRPHRWAFDSLSAPDPGNLPFIRKTRQIPGVSSGGGGGAGRRWNCPVHYIP